MNFLVRLLTACWEVWVAMAPYLLLGFAMAGLVSVGLSADWVRRHMGGRGLWQVIKASLLGVPLPLCSCGVLPVALSLRRQGASKGATVSFLASTPQTGVDSIVATYALLGPVVTVFRVVTAFMSGILAGGLVVAATRRDPVAPEINVAEGRTLQGALVPAWRRMISVGLVTLPRDVARPLLLGVLLSGLLTVVVPPDAMGKGFLPGWGSYLAALAIGIPLYVCSTASIPLAASFIFLGASPGAAMVFLIAGPATNASTIAVMWTQIGRLSTALYLGAIAFTAVFAGWMLDSFFAGAASAVPRLSERCSACGSTWWGLAAAGVLLILISPGLLPERDEE